jgi:choline dehydrogenase-like flavoprotein
VTRAAEAALWQHNRVADTDPLAHLDLTLLTALADAVVPADDYPSASQAGALTFLRRAFRGGQPAGRLAAFLVLVRRQADVLRCDPAADAARVLRALEADGVRDAPEGSARDGSARDGSARDGSAPDGSAPDGSAELRWFASLVSAGYYADASNGGNKGGASWTMVRWRPGPQEWGPGGWPPEHLRDEDRSGLIGFADADGRYDVIVIGSGAGGGAAASVYAKAGRRVLVVEAGRWPAAAELTGDHLRNPRAGFGFPQLPGAATVPGDNTAGNPRTYGGGTRVYGAQAWRFTETDFAMASTYGVPDGSALADWPIGYDDLEPYYTRAEWEMGVAGSPDGDTTAMPRSRDYPMAPLPRPAAARPLEAGARRLGLSTLAVPLLVNSVPYGGRGACVRCAECIGFACPAGAKAGSHNTTLATAIATGRCDILVNTRATRLLTDSAGRVTSAELHSGTGGPAARRVIAAAEFVAAAGAVESARLLLNSAHDGEPDGLGNNTGQVGRHLQGHVYAGATGVFGDDVADLLGPGPSIATCDYRHGNDGIVGGGMLADEFVPTPASTYAYLAGAGLIPWWGPEAKDGMRRLLRRMQRIVGPVQEVTSAGSRVTVDPEVRDRFGFPVARLHGSPHPEDVRGQRFLRERAAEWLAASGAVRVVRHPAAALDRGPSAGQHQAGTCRMGDDPASSVTDPLGRVWNHDNVRIADGSVHVTNGGVNPVLTIVANALRIADLAVFGGGSTGLRRG